MEPFKTAFSPDLVGWIAAHVARHQADFDAAAFRAAVLPGLDALELKARAQLIADALHQALPAAPADRARVLTAILHPGPFDEGIRASGPGGIRGWGILPLTMVVGQHGIADFDRSMAVLAEMTKRFSSEFGIRHFLLADQDRALAIMERWLDDPDRHVRRLVSEGSRPRLPWAMRLPALIADPSPVLPLLARLRDDPEPYVRRSVANHLNDISKDHPALLVRLAREWLEGAGKDRRALLSHACRSLIRKGDAAALALFGREPARLHPAPLRLSAGRVRMGEVLEIAMELRSADRDPQHLTVDYVLHFRKADGRLSPKVFKGANLTLAPGQTVAFRRSHRFREVTTRRHYPGMQAVSLRINGSDTDRVSFHLDC